MASILVYEMVLKLGLLPRDIDHLSGLRVAGDGRAQRDSQHRNRYSRHRTHCHYPLHYRPLLTFTKASVRFQNHCMHVTFGMHVWITKPTTVGVS